MSSDDTSGLPGYMKLLTYSLGSAALATLLSSAVCGAGDLRVHGLEQRISGGPSELNLLFLILANSLRIPRSRRQLDVV